MTALLKKDWRVYRVAVVGSVIVLAAPYFLSIIAIIYNKSELRDGEISSFALSASMADLWLTAILASVFGGVAFALERRERSADFLAMMPTSRARIIASKVVIASVCLVTMWLVNVTVFATSSYA